MKWPSQWSVIVTSAGVDGVQAAQQLGREVAREAVARHADLLAPS